VLEVDIFKALSVYSGPRNWEPVERRSAADKKVIALDQGENKAETLFLE